MDEVKRGIVNELHKQARKNFPRRKVYVKRIDDLWQIDLVDMQAYVKSNKGYKYILTIIDVWSKFAWVVPVRDKSAKNVTAAMQHVLGGGGERVPANIQCDQGREFYNKDFLALMSKYNINMYSTYSHLKASVVERFNRTLKSAMWKQFGIQGTYKWLDMLPELVVQYNNRVHRTTGFKPKDVTDTTVMPAGTLAQKRAVVKFKKGDVVRVSKYKTLFAKGYTANWSTELFKIARIRKTTPPVYYLIDMRGERVRGGFYAQELQKTKYPDTYLVERVLRRKPGGKVLVRWLGLDKSHDSWI